MSTLPVDETELLTLFKAGPLRQWPMDEIVSSALMRFAQAYLMMARGGKYRPEAPSDGLGTVMLSPEECRDRGRLYREAVDYACRFRTEEDSHEFYTGCSNYTTNRAFVLTIEAARLLCGGGDACAVKLLKLAIEEIEQNFFRLKERRNRR